MTLTSDMNSLRVGIEPTERKKFANTLINHYLWCISMYSFA